jgi:hypothetical protein
MPFHKIGNFVQRSCLVCFVLLAACTCGKKKPDETALARIGRRSITVDEFLKRSELTIRPLPFKDKNTTLNNLISEKILALEAEREDSLLKSPALNATLKGIKEQLMRDRLYEEAAAKQVRLDSAEVARAFRLSTREYELDFYTVRDAGLARKIEAKLDSLPGSADRMFREVEKTLGKRPVQKVRYKDPEDTAIHEALFSKPVGRGTVIGPLKLESGEFIVMKVLNWTDYPVIGYEEKQDQWNKVVEKITLNKARKAWTAFQVEVMRGKKLEFNRDSFKALSETALNYYLQNEGKDRLKPPRAEKLPADPNIDGGAPFFTIDGRTWTVDDFKHELMSHPLVYRTKVLNRANFNEQFRLAVADMVRDHYLTQEAYERALDRSGEIQRTEGMWRDAFLAARQEKCVVQSALKRGLVRAEDQPGMLAYWTRYLEGLQGRYGGSIRVDRKALDAVSLTPIELTVMRAGVPYPAAVPAFPMYTDSKNLEYIKHFNP